MLTDTQCRTARPKEKLFRLNDFNGLYLEVKPNGKRAWRYRFKLNGKSSMFALGEYPMVKLAEARKKCEQARSRSWQQQQKVRHFLTLSLLPGRIYRLAKCNRIREAIYEFDRFSANVKNIVLYSITGNCSDTATSQLPNVHINIFC